MKGLAKDKSTIFVSVTPIRSLFNNNNKSMDVSEADKQQAAVYITILGVLELLLIVFTLVAGQRSLLMFNIMRILLLVGAHCLKNVTWAAYYTIFALIAALFVIDPVGLWLIGHGQAHTRIQNVFIFFLLLGSIIAVVLGYFYKKTLENQLEEDFMGDANPVGYTNPNTNQNQYLYKPGNNAQPASDPQSKKFDQFSGQGYSLT